MNDKNKLISVLEAERERLLSLRATVGSGDSDAGGELAANELSTVDQHPADLGTETFERTRDLSILQTIEAQLVDVDHALKRVDEGTYGTCEACGQPIGSERLEALPAARLCIADQELSEREIQAG